MLRSSSRKRKAVEPFAPGLLTVKEQERKKINSHAMIKSQLQNRILLSQAQSILTQFIPCQQYILPPLNPYGIHIPKEGSKEERECLGIKAVMTEVHGNGKNLFKARRIAQSLKNGTLYNEDGMQAAKELTQNIGKMIFRPWRLAEAIATTGAINGQAIDALRQVQKPTPWERVMFPSAKTVHDEEKALEAWGSKEYDLTVDYLPADKQGKIAEGWGFDVESMIYYVLKKYGLLELAQTDGIEIKITFDGAELTGMKGHVCIGMQIVDKRARDPRTRATTPLYQDSAGNSANYQSRDGCVILRIALVNETKSVVKDYFGDIFEFVKRTGQYGLPGDGTEKRPPIRPIKWVGCCDKSAIWKISVGGGGCFNAHHHCNMCEQTKHELVSFTVGQDRCRRCREQQREKCRHWRVNDKEEVDRKEFELCMIIDDWVETARNEGDNESDDDSDEATAEAVPFDELVEKAIHIEEDIRIMANSKIIAHPEHAARTIDPNHIDFHPLNIEQARTFNSLLIQERELRGLTVCATDSLEVRREGLKRVLRQGLRVHRLRRCIDRDREKQEMMEVEKLVLCVMHAENRIAEKILKCLLGKGFEFRCSAKYDEYRAEVATHVNKEIFNHGEVSEGQWKFPMPDKNKSGTAKLIGDVKLSNAKARKFVEKVEVLLPVIFPDAPEGELAQWAEAMRLLKVSMAWLRKREDFTDDDIRSFQDTADDFIELWIELNGSEGMSCYLHDLGAGHFSYYLSKYRNLYRYSQQGTTISIIL